MQQFQKLIEQTGQRKLQIIFINLYPCISLCKLGKFNVSHFFPPFLTKNKDTKKEEESSSNKLMPTVIPFLNHNSYILSIAAFMGLPM